MKTQTILLTIVATFITAVAWSTPTITTHDDRADIRAIRLEQNRMLARRDIAAASKVWASDITVRAGLGRSLLGKDAYVAAFNSDSVMTYERVPNEIVVSGNWLLAYESGTWTGRAVNNPGAPALIGGRYSAQWQKLRGQWQIRSEVFVALNCADIACRWPMSEP